LMFCQPVRCRPRGVLLRGFKLSFVNQSKPHKSLNLPASQDSTIAARNAALASSRLSVTPPLGACGRHAHRLFVDHLGRTQQYRCAYGKAERRGGLAVQDHRCAGAGSHSPRPSVEGEPTVSTDYCAWTRLGSKGVTGYPRSLFALSATARARSTVSSIQ